MSQALNEYYGDESRSYAIGFANWLRENYTHFESFGIKRWLPKTNSSINGKTYLTEELYEIYIKHLNQEWQTKQ